MAKERLTTPEVFFQKYPLSVDHDGVMADTRSYVVQKVNAVLKTDYFVTDIDDWFWVRNVAVEHGWDLERATELHNKLWSDPNSLFQVPPTEGAIDFMRWFYDRGIKVPVITSRTSDLIKTTIDWYEEHMPFVDKKQIVISKNDEMRGDFFKVWAVKYMITPAIHIEDSTHHAQQIINYTETVVAFMSGSRALDMYKDTQLIRLMDNEYTVTLEGVREKIIHHPIFKSVAQC